MACTRPSVIRTLAALSAAAASTGLPYVAAAQQVDQGAIQEIVVTAQKREAKLEDVPFSVAATSQEQIVNSGAGNIVDLARNIAGLTIADLGPGQSQMAIRGVSSGQVIRDQPGVKEQVGVYLDESPISVALFTPDLELFDIDRFEVLRGPQGTLFGAGSDAGTVRYITKQPKLGAYEAYGDASLESPTGSGSSAGGSVRAAFNAPLGPNAAVRFVAYEHHLPGFIRAIEPTGPANSPSTTHVADGVNDGDRAGFRLSMLWKPTEELSITPRLVYQNLGTNGFPRVDTYNILANPNTTTQPPITIGDREQYIQLREGLSDDFRLADLKVDYNLGPATLTSVSSLTSRHVLVTRDASQLSGSVTFQVFGPIPQVRLDSPLLDHTHLTAISQEVRVASNGTQTFDWLGGGFFQHVGRRYGQALPTAGYDALNASAGFPLGFDPLAPPDNPFYSDLIYRFKQYAAFGEATYHVTNQWGLTGGLRYYKFDEDKLLNFHGVFTSDTPAGGVPSSVSSNGVSPRVILSYKATEDAQFNLQASRGFRLGGINDPINTGLPGCAGLAGNQYWADEKLWNYEIGSKLRFLDRHVTFNVAAFYEDIKNLQATVTVASCSSRLVYNVPKSRAIGLEAELFARPNTTWDYGISATWSDTKLESTVLDPNTGLVVGGLADANRLPTAPRFQGVASVGFTHPIAGGRDFFSVLTVQYVGSSFSQFENEQPDFGVINATGTPNFAAALIPYGAPPPGTTYTINPELSSYSLGNIRAGLRTDRWEGALYINNIWDETARLALDYERGRRARYSYLTNQPRTIGVYGSYRF